MLAILFLGMQSISAQDLKLTASVDRNPVGVSEPFVYQLVVSGTTQNLPNIELPDLSNFTLLSGPNQSSSFNMVNGAVTTSRTYSMELLPKKAGKHTFPAVAVEYRGRTYRSNAVTVTISANASGGSNTQSNRRNINEPYMRAVPSKRTVYVNEPFNVSFKVYFRQPVRNLNYIKQPETVGFWVEEFEIPSNIPVEKEVINGVEYNVATVKKLALFPTKSGELSVSPMQLSVNVQKNRRRDPFSMLDNFFDDPLGRTVRKVLSTKAIKINVRPVPQKGKPADYSGLVGSFTMRASLDKSSVEANQALSYKIRVNGNSNLKSLNNLEIPFPNSFEVYDPKVKDNTNLSSGYFKASRELEYVLIPRTAGDFQIKPFKFSFFDPASKTYKTLTSPQYDITVSEGKDLASGINSQYLQKSDVQLIGKDIHFIKEDALSLIPLGYKPYSGGWFWLALILPLAFFGIAYGYRNHQEKMSTNVEYARRRKALKQASKRLKTAEAFLKKEAFADFYGETARGLIGFVADKTNHAAAGLLRDDVLKILKERELESSLIDEYMKCLDEADFRRFAASAITSEEATAFYNRALEILAKLGKSF